MRLSMSMTFAHAYLIIKSAGWGNGAETAAARENPPPPPAHDGDIEMQSLGVADEPAGGPGAEVGGGLQNPPQSEGLAPNRNPVEPRNPTGGYASLSSFMASDKVFAIFRRFDVIAIRSLLYLQDELVELEESLHELDQADMNDGTPFDLWRLHSRRGDNNSERNEILVEIREKLKEYSRYSRAALIPVN
jgi:hypothetical protein